LARYCGNCGTEASESARFCTECGQKLPIATTTVTPDTVEVPAPAEAPNADEAPEGFWEAIGHMFVSDWAGAEAALAEICRAGCLGTNGQSCPDMCSRVTG